MRSHSRPATTAEERTPGDTFLLLSHFPIGVLDEELPLRVGPGVYLESIPTALLKALDPPAWADFVLPGYNVDPDQFRYCLRSPSAESAVLKHEPTFLFFNSLTALRLHSPLHICAEGRIRVRGDAPFDYWRALHLASPWKPEWGGFYAPPDLEGAARIAQRQLEVFLLANDHVGSEILYFLQVTCGFSISFQLAYLGLFAALEALLCPKKTNAQALSRRTAKFLSNMPPPTGWQIENWIYSEYKDVRNKLSHGEQHVDPWRDGLSPENRQRLGRLHEIVRLCILGFIDLSDPELLDMGKAKGTNLQALLDGLIPPSRGFITGQRMWCD